MDMAQDHLTISLRPAWQRSVWLGVWPAWQLGIRGEARLLLATALMAASALSLVMPKCPPLDPSMAAETPMVPARHHRLPLLHTAVELTAHQEILEATASEVLAVLAVLEVLEVLEALTITARLPVALPLMVWTQGCETLPVQETRLAHEARRAHEVTVLIAPPPGSPLHPKTVASTPSQLLARAGRTLTDPTRQPPAGSMLSLRAP
jgi:hypothetical protein